MLPSVIVYCGLLLAAIGVVCIIKPIRRIQIPTRRRALGVVATGITLAVAGMLLPAREVRAATMTTRLDQLVPVWQFREFHSIEVDAPPAVVLDAIRTVRANDIRFFRALTWIRRGGRQLPQGILNAGTDRPLIDVALSSGFIRLHDDSVRELVIGTAVVVPPNDSTTRRAHLFKTRLPPGFAIAAMNFVVVPKGARSSLVTTETRTFANSPSARRQFATYWRLIYPGSALIRRMWLRAVKSRAEGQQQASPMSVDPTRVPVRR